MHEREQREVQTAAQPALYKRKAGRGRAQLVSQRRRVRRVGSTHCSNKTGAVISSRPRPYAMTVHAVGDRSNKFLPLGVAALAVDLSSREKLFCSLVNKPQNRVVNTAKKYSLK